MPRGKRTIFSTAIIDSMLQEQAQGYEISWEPFYNRDITLKASNIIFEMTREEYDEYLHCYDDPLYYVSNYCKFETDNDYQLVELRDFQKKLIRIVTAEKYIPELDAYGPVNRNIIWMAARQSGKTTTIASFISWMLVFHAGRNILIAANKEDTAKEIVDKLKNIFKHLPFFLKPGCENFGMTGLSLENGSRILSTATTNTASIGFTLHLVLLDEFAHIPENIVNNFWRSVYPTLSSSKISQCIITSTPNGTSNKFYDIWSKSVEGKNSFVNMRTDYWEVPSHDAKWAAEQRANFGDEEFAQEFELQFSANSRMLLTGEDLSFMSLMCKEYEHKVIMSNSTFLNDPELMWHPNFDPNNINRGDRFIFLVDVAEGEEINLSKTKKDPDFHTISIFKIVPNSPANMRRYFNESCNIKDAFRYVQVGRWMSREQDEIYCGKMLASLAYDLFNDQLLDNVRIMLEMNFNGKACIEGMRKHRFFTESTILKTYHSKPIPGQFQRKKLGFKTTTNKENFCLKGKKLIQKKRVIVTDNKTKDQIHSFGYVKGKLKGIACHDDLSMPVFNHIPRMLEETSFTDWLNDYLYMYYDPVKKFRINEILKKWAFENPEMTDNEFNELYKNDSNPSPIVMGQPATPSNPYSMTSYNIGNPYSSGAISNPYSSQGGPTTGNPYSMGPTTGNPYLSGFNNF